MSGAALAGRGHYDAVLCINMIHISPWRATHALAGAAPRVTCRRREAGAVRPLSGRRRGRASNLEFDASLKRRNPEWGLRELEEVTRVAATHGLQRQQVVRMPANNLTVVFARAP